MISKDVIIKFQVVISLWLIFINAWWRVWAIQYQKLGQPCNEKYRWGTTSYSWWLEHYSDVIMSMMASQITSLMIVYSNVYSGTDQRKHQSSMSLAFVQRIHWCPVNSPHKGPVMRNMFPFDDFIMKTSEKDDLSYTSLTHWGRGKMVAISQT